MEILSVNMLGIPSIRIDETPVVLPYRKAEALLYYLILKKKVSRSFWSCARIFLCAVM